MRAECCSVGRLSRRHGICFGGCVVAMVVGEVVNTVFQVRMWEWWGGGISASSEEC